ncbi:WD40/YVTN/BNR-like repeat-containing protein [Cognatiluteimonas weifangensis]|nr:hypothetical protein [Luteimonas weifangensis]
MSPMPILLLVATLFAAGAARAGEAVRILPQDSGVEVRLRGISAVDADVAWASGREGTVLRTIDGGAHWRALEVPGAGALDFRDIEGFDADTAVVLSIGPGAASRVYRTEDGGKSWSLTLQNDDPRAFFDCMAFRGERGWLLGDPVDGRFQIYASADGGRSWRLQETRMPQARADEAAFAASGTCIAPTPWGEQLAVSGGGAARVYLGDSGQREWWAVDSGLPSRVPAAGLFSATPMGEDMLLVGGDFEHEAAAGSAARVRFVDGHGMTVEALPAPRGYRSGAACAGAGDARCVAVGPSGVDALVDGAWRGVSETGYDAVDFAGGVGWASGDAGRIARIEFSD